MIQFVAFVVIALVGMPYCLAFNASEVVARPFFHKLIQAHEVYEPIPEKKLSRLKLGDTFWGEIKWLKPGQTRYSFDLSVRKLVKNAGVPKPIHYLKEYQKREKEFPRSPSKLLKYHKHRSLLPPKEIVEVALTDHGLILVDGHHDVMASLAVNARHIRMRVRMDMRGQSQEQALQNLWLQGGIYPVGFHNHVGLPQHFYEMVDDPNRYLIALLTASFILDQDGRVKEVKTKGDGEYPVFLKFEPHALPFQELRISDLLGRYGVRYKASRYGNKVPEILQEEIRDLMAITRAEEAEELRHVTIVSERMSLAEIPIEEYLAEHYQVICSARYEPRELTCPALMVAL